MEDEKKTEQPGEQPQYDFRSLRQMREMRDSMKAKENRLIFALRQTLNLLFMISFVVAVIIFFVNRDSNLYIYVCGAAVFFKLVEFILRYVKK